MSDNANPQGTAAPAAADNQAAPPAQPGTIPQAPAQQVAAAQPPAAPAQQSQQVPEAPPNQVPLQLPERDPGWLKGRLERAQDEARKSILVELGVTDPAAAKAAIEAAKAAEEANKTAEQRAAELSTQVSSFKTEAERLSAITREHAARMMVVLTPEQQEAVKQVAGDDPGQQLKTIGAMGPTWAKQAEQVQQAAQEAAQAQAAAEQTHANTAPAPDAPAGTQQQSPPDHKTVYSSMRSSNPFAAAAYGLSHPEVYSSDS